MVPSDSAAVPVMSPGARMASWSFYLGLVGLLAVAISPIARILPFLVPLLLFGGLGQGVIAVVLGLVGLPSINRASALAGLLMGALAIVMFLVYVFYAVGGITL